MADKGLVIDFKLCSNNVTGLNDRKKRSKYFTWLSENKLDIACLQETFCTANNQSEFNKNWEGQSYHSLSDSPHSRGVAIFFLFLASVELGRFLYFLDPFTNFTSYGLQRVTNFISP